MRSKIMVTMTIVALIALASITPTSVYGDEETIESGGSGGYVWAQLAQFDGTQHEVRSQGV